MAHHVLVLWVMDQLRGSWRLRMLRWGRRRRQRQGLLARCWLCLLLRLRLLCWWLRLLPALPWTWLLLRHLLRRIGELLQPEPDLVSIAVTACTRQNVTLRWNAALLEGHPFLKANAGKPSNTLHQMLSDTSREENACRPTSLACIASLPGCIAIGRTLRVAILWRRSWAIGKVACSRRRGCPLHRWHHDRGRERWIAWIAL